MIKIEEQKAEKMSEYAEKMLKYGGKLMQCIEEMSDGGYGERGYDDDEDDDDEEFVMMGQRGGQGGSGGMRMGERRSRGRNGRYR